MSEVQINFRVTAARVLVDSFKVTPKLRYGVRVSHLDRVVENPDFKLPEILRGAPGAGVDEFITRWLRVPIPVLTTFDPVTWKLTRPQLFTVILLTQDERGNVETIAQKTIQIQKYANVSRPGKLSLLPNASVELELSMQLMRGGDVSPVSLSSVAQELTGRRSVIDFDGRRSVNAEEMAELMALQSFIEKTRKENMELMHELQDVRRKHEQFKEVVEETHKMRPGRGGGKGGPAGVSKNPGGPGGDRGKAPCQCQIQ